MPLDFSILKKFGCDNERLREFFTCKMPDVKEENPSEEKKEEYARIERDIAARDRFCKKVRSRLNEHILFSLKNYALYAAADMAWDATPINKATIPLMLYAQGKIKIESCVKQLSEIGCADEFTKKDDKGVIKEINLPKFYEFSVNLVRSIITRRLAAQTNKYNSFWPYYYYEPRGTGLISKLRGDVLSQRVDIMSDQFDYRHHDAQWYRDAFLYGHSVDFVRASWEVEKQWAKKPRPPELENSEKFEVEDVITKEGVCFINPHPSRVFWDNASPLCSINSDSGCNYIGFWDVTRYREIAGNVLYFNRDKIPFSQNLWQLYSTYGSYFNQYLNTISVPGAPAQQGIDLAGQNDRQNNVGLYTGDLADSSIFKAEYYEKVVPKEMGIGDYPFPVWMRFTFASDDTCVFAEILPSTPCSVCSLNENDSRQVNISMAHEIMGFQDQMSNLATQMLLMVETQLLKVITINKDVLGDTPDDIAKNEKAIKEQLTGKNYSHTPLVVSFSSSKLGENGLDKTDVVKIHETKVAETINAIFNAMAQLIAMMEKLLALSPAEQGQPAPREISATESANIERTTQAVYSFISDAIDEARAAKKRIIYESLITCSKGEFKAPVMDRYPKSVIEKAGFTILADEVEVLPGQESVRHTLLGKPSALSQEYIFTSRDGAERPVNSQAANTLVQLLAQIVNFPPILNAIGKEKLYEIFNEIFRLSGAGVPLNLELKQGESNEFGQDEIKELTALVQRLAEAVQQQSNDIAILKTEVPRLAEAVKNNAEAITRLFAMQTNNKN